MSNILIAESEGLSRHALRQVIESDGHKIVGEASDGLQAVRQAIEKSPDLLIIALRLDRLSGVEVVKRLRSMKCPAKILVVSSQDDPHSIGLCIAAGANGFVSKLDDVSELQRALDALQRGRTYFPDLGEEHDVAKQDEASQLSHLSDRERSVLAYLARGYRLTKIAQLLVVSESTVSTYKTRLLRKLNATSVVELADIARRNNLTGNPNHCSESHGMPSWMADESSVVSNLLDSIPTALSIRDKQGNVLFANAYLREQSGALFDEVAARKSESLARVLGMTEHQADALRKAFERSAASGEPFAQEYALTLHGLPRSAIIWSAPLLDEQGQVLALVSGIQDITSIDMTIRELRQSREELGRLAKLRSLLLSDLERDLASPLQVGLESISKARAAIGNSIAAERHLADAEHAMLTLEHRLANIQVLVEDVAESARPLRERCNLKALFETASQPAMEVARRDGRDLALEFIGPSALRIWADAPRFRHVVFAVIDIAYRASASGPITVRMVADKKTRGLVEVGLDIHAPAAGTSLQMFGPELSRLKDILGGWAGTLRYDDCAGHTQISTSAVLQAVAE